MKSWVLLAGLLASSVSMAASETKVVDALDFTTVLKTDHPSRIVTLAPSLAEIVASVAGASNLDRIAGVSEYTDYPPELKTRTSVGSYVQVNLEAISALKPDLIVATTDGNSRDQVTHLRELGFPVVVVKAASLSDIEKSIEIIGRAMGDTESAAAQLARFRAGEEQIRDHAKVRNLHPSVLFEISSDPLIVAGKATFISDAIELVGAKNAFADLTAGYPRPSLEEAVRRDPDVIIIPTVRPDSADFKTEVGTWQRFTQMKAVRAGKIKSVPSDLLLRPSPRILQGIIALEHAIFTH